MSRSSGKQHIPTCDFPEEEIGLFSNSANSARVYDLSSQPQPKMPGRTSPGFPNSGPFAFRGIHRPSIPALLPPPASDETPQSAVSKPRHDEAEGASTPNTPSEGDPMKEPSLRLQENVDAEQVNSDGKLRSDSTQLQGKVLLPEQGPLPGDTSAPKSASTPEGIRDSRDLQRKSSRESREEAAPHGASSQDSNVATNEAALEADQPAGGTLEGSRSISFLERLRQWYGMAFKAGK